MSSDSNQNKPNQEEIDLLLLFMKFGDFLKRFFLGLVSFVGSALVFLLQKWYYFFIAIVLCVLSAFLLNITTEDHYHSDLTLRSNATTNQPIMSYIDKLGDYARLKNHSELANKLDLSADEASAIKGIETHWYFDIGKDGIFDGLDIEGEFLADTSVRKIDSIFVVRARVYEPEILPNLELGIKNYLENQPFLESLNKQRQTNLQAQIVQIDYEIEKLDSLQKREYYTNPDELRQKEGQIVFTSEKVVRMYHSQMFRLLELKQECERDLSLFGDVVTILEAFPIPNSPDNGVVKSTVKLMWYFLGLALILALLIRYRKEIWVR